MLNWIDCNLPWETVAKPFPTAPEEFTFCGKAKEALGLDVHSLDERLNILVWELASDEERAARIALEQTEGVDPGAFRHFNNMKAHEIFKEKQTAYLNANPTLYPIHAEINTVKADILQVENWIDRQPEFVEYYKKVAEWEKTKGLGDNSFTSLGLNKPGTLIEFEDGKRFLIGDVNEEGTAKRTHNLESIFNDFKSNSKFWDDRIVKRYAVLDLNENPIQEIDSANLALQVEAAFKQAQEEIENPRTTTQNDLANMWVDPDEVPNLLKRKVDYKKELIKNVINKNPIVKRVEPTPPITNSEAKVLDHEVSTVNQNSQIDPTVVNYFKFHDFKKAVLLVLSKHYFVGAKPVFGDPDLSTQTGIDFEFQDGSHLHYTLPLHELSEGLSSLFFNWATTYEPIEKLKEVLEPKTLQATKALGQLFTDFKEWFQEVNRLVNFLDFEDLVQSDDLVRQAVGYEVQFKGGKVEWVGLSVQALKDAPPILKRAMQTTEGKEALIQSFIQRKPLEEEAKKETSSGDIKCFDFADLVRTIKNCIEAPQARIVSIKRLRTHPVRVQVEHADSTLQVFTCAFDDEWRTRPEIPEVWRDYAAECMEDINEMLEKDELVDGLDAWEYAFEEMLDDAKTTHARLVEALNGEQFLSILALDARPENTEIVKAVQPFEDEDNKTIGFYYDLKDGSRVSLFIAWENLIASSPHWLVQLLQREEGLNILFDAASIKKESQPWEEAINQVIISQNPPEEKFSSFANLIKTILKDIDSGLVEAIELRTHGYVWHFTDGSNRYGTTIHDYFTWDQDPNVSEDFKYLVQVARSNNSKSPFIEAFTSLIAQSKTPAAGIHVKADTRLQLVGDFVNHVLDQIHHHGVDEIQRSEHNHSFFSLIGNDGPTTVICSELAVEGGSADWLVYDNENLLPSEIKMIILEYWQKIANRDEVGLSNALSLALLEFFHKEIQSLKKEVESSAYISPTFIDFLQQIHIAVENPTFVELLPADDPYRLVKGYVATFEDGSAQSIGIKISTIHTDKDVPDLFRKALLTHQGQMEILEIFNSWATNSTEDTQRPASPTDAIHLLIENGALIENLQDEADDEPTQEEAPPIVSPAPDITETPHLIETPSNKNPELFTALASLALAGLAGFIPTKKNKAKIPPKVPAPTEKVKATAPVEEPAYV